MKWVTREHPRTDRIACPWLIRRFIDPDAEIVYVPRDEVLALRRAGGCRSASTGPAPATRTAMGSARSRSSSAEHGIDDPAVALMARVIHGADVSEDLGIIARVGGPPRHRGRLRAPRDSMTSANSRSSCPFTTPCTPGLSGRALVADLARGRARVGCRHGARFVSAEPIRRLRRVQAAGPPIQPREVLSGRRLADAQLVGRSRDRAGRDVGPQDLELAPGRAAASPSAGLPLVDRPHLRRPGHVLEHESRPDSEGGSSWRYPSRPDQTHPSDHRSRAPPVMPRRDRGPRHRV